MSRCPECQETLAELDAYANHRFDFHRVDAAQAVIEWDAAAAARVKETVARAKARRLEPPGSEAAAAARGPATTIEKTLGGQTIRLRIARAADVKAALSADASPGGPGTPARRSPPKEDRPMTYPCPETGCDRTFTKPQGVGRHRAHAHGYRRKKKPAPRSAAPRAGKRHREAPIPSPRGAAPAASAPPIDFLASIRQARERCDAWAKSWTEAAESLRKVEALAASESLRA